MSLHVKKLQALLRENAIDEEEFAFCLGIDTSAAELLCRGKRKLTKSLARQIEQTFSKPLNWLEVDEASQGPDYDLFG